MSSGERPLLARPPSESSRGAEEEDALLTGQPTRKTENRKQKYREIGAWSIAALMSIVVIILAVLYSQEKASKQEKSTDEECDSDNKKIEGKRNLIFMVSDGMGPTSLELARSYRQYVQKLPWNDTLTLDKHLIGQSRTRSSSTLVTDSAAGATAFSCGFKSYNGAISVFPDRTPCGTVLEAAKKAGYMTGLVVTTLVTDATPACFASHVQTRSYQDLIAEQMLGYYPLGRMVDVIIGGGRCHFLPNTDSASCRSDDKDLVSMAKKDGWTYVDNMEDFKNLDPAGSLKLPLLALMDDEDMPYEINRRHAIDQHPSQYDMAQVALQALQAATNSSAKGFFLMIEGSRIDHAGHANDPAAQAHEVLMHDKTFASVLSFLNSSTTPGVLVSTSDHETGGLAAARQLHTSYPEYLWYPSVLAAANYSASYLGHQWKDYIRSTTGSSATNEEKSTFVKSIMPGLGITDVTDDEVQHVIDNGDGTGSGSISPKYIFADMISRRAEIGWSTHGHTGADVNIYGSEPKYLSPLLGNHENTEVGRFLAEFLGVDVSGVTEELQKSNITTKPVKKTTTKTKMKTTLANLDGAKKAKLRQRQRIDDGEGRLYVDEYHGYM